GPSDSPFDRVWTKLPPKPAPIVFTPTLGLKLASGAGDMLDSMAKFVSDIIRYRTPVRYLFLSTYQQKHHHHHHQHRRYKTDDDLEEGARYEVNDGYTELGGLDQTSNGSFEQSPTRMPDANTTATDQLIGSILGGLANFYH